MLEVGDSVGKYRIERQLGRGGMGIVFLAFDETLERRLAIKVLNSSEDIDTGARLLREARNASALNHPNICTVYEVGEGEHGAFIAMEYVEGRSLAGLLSSGPLPIDDAVRYAIQGADALAHAHDRGIVHRDLKAANVIVSPAGRLKLLDFGLSQRLASDVDATTSYRAGVTAGTPYAMAPEQVNGTAVDVRTDVWALGVLLYEMLAGARPFAGSTTPELFSAILRDPPAPLPSHIPNALGQIAQKCLAKDPAHRYERAADIRLVLEAAAAGSVRDSSAALTTIVQPGAPLPPPPTLGVATQAGLVGRDHELTQLARVWDLAKSGRRQLVLLAGEPGIGKTRLSAECASRCAAEGATALIGRSEEEALVPYQPFVEALSWYARICPESELRAQLAAIGGGAELGQFVVELLRRVPDLPARSAMNAEGERYRLLEAVDALLSAASAAHPVLMVLDDLHWADKPTLVMLRHMVRSTRQGSLCFIGTYRESELGRTQPLAEMLADLRRDPAVTRVSLRGLDQADVRGLVGALAGRESPPQLARVIADSTGGNPFFVAEMLRHLQETGTLDRFDALRDGQSLGDLGLPEGVKEVIGRRLSRLSDDCNRVLSLAAVMGREFSIDALEALGDLPENRLLDAIDDGIRAQLLVEVPGRAGRFAFVHALIRETLYDELTSSRRARLHRRVGEALEQLARGRPNPPLADLAYHFVQAASAGAADKAIDYAMRAGDRAADALAHEEAARFYDMALQSLELESGGTDMTARRVDLHARRARAFGALGQWAFAKADLERALEHLDPQQMERRRDLLLELSMTVFFLLDIPSTRQLAAEALALSEKSQRSDLAAQAIGLLGACQSADGDLPLAIESYGAALDRDGTAGMTWFRANLALGLYWTGRTTEAVDVGWRSARDARSSRNTTHVMWALSSFGLSLAAAGRYREAAATFEEARQFGRKYGVRPLLARAIAMSAGFHLSVFDFTGAESIQMEARELARSVDFVPPVVSADIDLLLTLARRHDPGRAETLLDETIAAAAAASGWHGWLWRLRLTQARAELALARGSAEEALAEASAAIEQCRARGRLKYEALGLITRARALHGLSRTHDGIADARAGLAVARDTLDPALMLVALDALLALDGSDELAAEARALCDRILGELPDEAMRQRFADSEVVQRVGLH